MTERASSPNLPGDGVMIPVGPDGEAPWLVDLCTLPTIQQPLRIAEFGALLNGALKSMDRPSPTTLRIELAAEAEPAARDLAARESECCSFFTFRFTSTTESLWVEVDVPPANEDVLDALSVHAAA